MRTEPPALGRRQTLQVRITVVAGLVITAAVLLGVALLYLLQIHAVRTTLDSQLRTYATQIAQSAPAGDWPGVLAPSTLDANAEAQVVAADGQVLSATRSLVGVPAVYALSAASNTPVRLKAADGIIPGDVRVVAIRRTIAGRPVTIIAGTPTTLLSQLRAAFTSQLLLGFPITLLAAAAAVWLIVGRALRPVEQIRHAVTEITSADLSQRVPEPGTPDEIGHLAHTMNEMLARLEDAARRQRRFVADASHELRTPIAAIRTTLEVGLAHPDKAPWPVIAERATGQSNRLAGLIQQLLLLAKADEHQLTLRQDRVNLARVLRELAASTPPVEVRLDVAGDVMAVGNTDHLDRAFRNVFENAIRYARTNVNIRARTTATHVVVEIADDGPGVPLAERERVFDRFVRLDNSREGSDGNTGLGLAIAREIIRAHDGDIRIGDSDTGGALVTITLPAEAPSGSHLA
jgi:signal transduction histidine kinase